MFSGQNQGRIHKMTLAIMERKIHMGQPDTTLKDRLVQPVIVQILPALNRGGVERGTLETAKAIIDAGWRAVVISSGGHLVPQLQRLGATHHTLPVHTKNPLKWGLIRRQISSILKSEHADLVHVRSRVPAWIALPAAKKLNIPSVATIHSKFQAGNLFKHRYNAKMLSADRVISISHYVESVLQSQYSRHYRAEAGSVIHRGADMDQFNPENVAQSRIVREAERLKIPLDMPVIMLPARPTKWKGHDLLLDALAQREDKNFCVILLGADVQGAKFSEQLRVKALRLGLGGQVRLATASDDMPAALMLADVVAMPSTLPEPFGRVAIEAQAMGRPVVAFDHGGAVESIIDGKTGWLAVPNDVSSLADIVDKALGLSADERTEFAKTARSHAETHFSVAQMCSKTLAIYRELLRFS